MRNAWMSSWSGPSDSAFISAAGSAKKPLNGPSNGIATLHDEPQVPPTPTPSEESEWQPVRPVPTKVEKSMPNTRTGALVRNNNTAVVPQQGNNTFQQRNAGNLDPLVIPPPELRHRSVGGAGAKKGK